MKKDNVRPALIEVQWTGEYPTLCYGEWKLFIKGEDCSKIIPKDLRKNSDMNTYGKYDSWHFHNSHEVWDSYEDGLHEDDWIQANINWLKKLPIEDKMYNDIFHAFNEKDWRHGCCGGCI